MLVSMVTEVALTQQQPKSPFQLLQTRYPPLLVMRRPTLFSLSTPVVDCHG